MRWPTRTNVHRDLKSANVVCDHESRPKILDFGLATTLPRVSAEQITQAQPSLDERLIGTVAYMAPELLRGGEADERSDLWALGVVLYEMLTGGLPFRGAGTYDVAAAILEHPVATLPASVPPSMSRLVMRLLEKDPVDRYRRAAEVKAVLELVRDDEQMSSRPKARAARVPLSAVTAAVLAIAAALLWWQLGRSRPMSLGEERLVSTFEGSRRAPSYSPDGSMLAFAAPDEKGVDQLWVTKLGQEHPLQITFGPRPHMHPSRWSPDGTSIVGARHDGKAWICPADGSACRVVTSGAAPVWSGDARRIFVLRPANDSSAPQELWSVSTDGSDERKIVSLGVFRSIDRFFDVSTEGVLVWAPFVAGRYQLWTATVK